MSNVIATQIQLNGENKTQQMFRQVEASAKGLAGQFSVFKGFDLGTMLGLSGTVAKVAALSAAFAQAVKTADRLQGIESAFEAITGSSTEAEERLERIREQARLLGQDYLSLADLTKQWLASTKDTAIEKYQDEILQGFLSYGAVLKIPEEQLQRMVTALSQMASKGKIYAEELRGQLGEALPGAFNMLAKSMNKSTEELNKMLENGEVGLENLVLLAKDLQKEYGGKVGESSDTVANNLMRGKNELVEITQLILEGANAYNIFNEAIKISVNLLGGFKEGLEVQIGFIKNFKTMLSGGLSMGEFLDASEIMNNADYFDSVFGKLDLIEIRKKEIEDKLSALSKDIAVAEKMLLPGEFEFYKESLGISDFQNELAALEKEQEALFAELDRMYERGLAYQNSAMSKPETVKPKSQSELKKEQKVYEKTAKDLAKLNDEIARLIMTDEEYREFSLDKKLAELTRSLPFATEEIKLFAKAQKDAWAKEDAENALEKQKENLDVQAKFYEELAKKTGQYEKSLAFQNRLIDEQVQVWKQAQIPDEYVEKMEKMLRLEVSQNPLDSFMLGANETYAQYGNLAVRMKDVYTSAFSEMTDALTEWASGAEVSFSDVAQSFTKMLLQMSIQYTMSNLANSIFGGIGSVFGGIFGGSSLGGGGDFLNMSSALTSYVPTFHEGGMADSPAVIRAVQGNIFANAPRYHGGYNPSFEQPAILRKDERVLSPSETYAYNMGFGMGGKNASIVINQEIVLNVAENNADMTLKEQDMTALRNQMKKEMEMSVMQIIGAERRAGGFLR